MEWIRVARSSHHLKWQTTLFIQGQQKLGDLQLDANHEKNMSSPI
jgi:hypothetical protein